MVEVLPVHAFPRCPEVDFRLSPRAQAVMLSGQMRDVMAKVQGQRGLVALI